MYTFSLTAAVLGFFMVTAGGSFAFHDQAPRCSLGHEPIERAGHYYCSDTFMFHTKQDGAIDGHDHPNPALRYCTKSGGRCW